MHDDPSHSALPVIALLTDFGLSDGYVGVMKGVIAGINPSIQLIDITHAIPPQDIAQGARLLATSYRYFPAGTIFTCVVDPGVGSARGAIAIHCGNWYFVGPDNGLFSYVLVEQPVHEAVELSNAAYRLPQVSTTFQGRDVFAPAAAHLARGIALSNLGPRLPASALLRLPIKQPVREEDCIQGQVVHIDHFGNLVTSIPSSMVPDLFSRARTELKFSTSPVIVTERRRFFSDGPQNADRSTIPFIYIDSSGYLAVAVRNASAAQLLGVQQGEYSTLVLGDG